MGQSWAILRTSLNPLGVLMGHRGAILEPEEPIGREKARRQKHVEKHNGFEGIWPLGGLLGKLGGHLEPSWGGLVGSWRRVENYLEPFWNPLRDLGCHLGLSGALLEPSWAILEAPAPRETPLQVQVEVVWGRGLWGPPSGPFQGFLGCVRAISARLAPAGAATGVFLVRFEVLSRREAAAWGCVCVVLGPMSGFLGAARGALWSTLGPHRAADWLA